MSFTISTGDRKWIVSDGPALLYFNYTPRGEAVVYRVDDPESFITVNGLGDRDLAILGALMRMGMGKLES